MLHLFQIITIELKRVSFSHRGSVRHETQHEYLFAGAKSGQKSKFAVRT